MNELMMARKSAWSIESMATHGAEGRDITPVGKEVINGAVYEYFKDSAGMYWYKSSAGAELEKVIKRRKAERNAEKIAANQ